MKMRMPDGKDEEAERQNFTVENSIVRIITEEGVIIELKFSINNVFKLVNVKSKDGSGRPSYLIEHPYVVNVIVPAHLSDPDTIKIEKPKIESPEEKKKGIFRQKDHL
jgi:hypothetical protein